ncbi:MAG: protein-L-isoaspartate(D-aspartate) O-methyltransferase [Caldimonas sp.]
MGKIPPPPASGLCSRMVDEQIASRGIDDAALLAAMRAVPREAFVPEDEREFAYEDAPLPIGVGQTISQPYIVALMLEAAQIGANDRVLEIGAGSGYATAVASLLAARVYAIERHRSLAGAALERLRALGYAENVELRCGDGSGGWPEAAPFDAIIVSAGAPGVPAALRDQLGPGGRLVLPVGPEERSQRLVKVTRRSATRFDEETLCDVRFVPLIGEHAWPEFPVRPKGGPKS